MDQRTHLAIALSLSGLGLVPGGAHVLELPVKLGYAPGMYADVTSTLYRYFGIAGGSVQIAALIAVAALAVRLRRSPLAGSAAASAAAFFVSLALWGAMVAPVNAAWADVAQANRVGFVSAYALRQWQWEFGHVAAFIAWCTGWCALVMVATRRGA